MQAQYPSEEAKIRAALNVRRDIQAVAAAAGDRLPQLGPSIHAAHLALHTMRQSGLGDDVQALYERLLDVVVSAEDVATRIRVSYPDLTVEAAA